MPMLRRPETKGKQKLASQKKTYYTSKAVLKGGLTTTSTTGKNLALHAAEASRGERLRLRCYSRCEQICFAVRFILLSALKVFGRLNSSWLSSPKRKKR